MKVLIFDDIKQISNKYGFSSNSNYFCRSLFVINYFKISY